WAIFVWRQDKSGLEQGLKAIADTEDQPVGVAEALYRFSQKVPQLVGENFAGGHVVAVGEAAGDHQNLVAEQPFGILPQPVDVGTFGEASRQLKCKLGLGVAVGAGGSQNQDARFGHELPVTLL